MSIDTEEIRRILTACDQERSCIENWSLFIKISIVLRQGFFGDLQLCTPHKRSLTTQVSFPEDNPTKTSSFQAEGIYTVMRWPPWSSGPQKDTDNGEKDKDKSEHNSITSSLTSSFNATDPDTSSPSKKREWNSILNATDWKQFSEPQNLIPTVILTTGILFAVHLHRRFLRRIPEASNINPSYFRRRSLLGRVTSVGDGDNFRLYHTPGGRLAGWGWLPWKKVPTSRKELKDRTVIALLS